MLGHLDFDALASSQWPLAARLHAAGSLAPLAAALTTSGAVEGMALVGPEHAGLDADQAISILGDKLFARVKAGEIRASLILFHGTDRGQGPVMPALSASEANAIVLFLDHRDGTAEAAVYGYARGEAGAWRYSAPKVFKKRPVIFAP